MLEIAEITDPTGNAYVPGWRNRITDLVTGRVTDLGCDQLISDETGKESILTPQEQPDNIRDVLPYKLLAEITGADIYECREFLGIIGTKVASHNSTTNACIIVDACISRQLRMNPPKPVSVHSSQEVSFPRKELAIADLANSLREFSGLDIESLAQIFNVSRATYHRWLRGLPVSKRHRNYILEILPLIEEAAQRLGSPEAVSIWLLTPVSSGGKKPIEYLAEKRYDLFRGFLLHQRTGKEHFRPLKPSGRVFKPRKSEDVEDIRERQRPHTWYDEENDPQ